MESEDLRVEEVVRPGGVEAGEVVGFERGHGRSILASGADNKLNLRSYVDAMSFLRLSMSLISFR